MSVGAAPHIIMLPKKPESESTVPQLATVLKTLITKPGKMTADRVVIPTDMVETLMTLIYAEELQEKRNKERYNASEDRF